MTPWFGIVVPSKTPALIIAKINEALEAAVAAPEVRFGRLSAKRAPLGEFAAVIKSDIALWAKVVKEAAFPRTDFAASNRARLVSPSR